MKCGEIWKEDREIYIFYFTDGREEEIEVVRLEEKPETRITVEVEFLDGEVKRYDKTELHAYLKL